MNDQWMTKLSLSLYLIGLDENGGLEGKTLLLFDVVGYVAQALFHDTDGLEVGGVVESVASQQKKL